LININAFTNNCQDNNFKEDVTHQRKIDLYPTIGIELIKMENYLLLKKIVYPICTNISMNVITIEPFFSRTIIQ